MVTVTKGGIALVNQRNLFTLESPAISPDGRELYVATRDEHVDVLDPATLERVGSIPVDVRTHRIVVTSDGRKAYVFGALAAGDPDYGTAIVDLGTRQEAGRMEGGFQFADLSPDGRTLFIAADPTRFGKNMLEAVSTDTDSLQGTVELSGFVLWVDLAPSVPYGAALTTGPGGTGAPRVSLFDLLTFGVTQTIPLDGIGSALWTTLRPGTSEIYVLVEASSEFVRRDVQRLPPVDPRPRLRIIKVPDGAVSEIDLQVSPDTEFGALSPYEWSEDGRFLYVAGESGLVVIDAANRQIVARVPPTVADGCDVVLHPTLPYLYLTDYFGELSALDLSGFPPR